MSVFYVNDSFKLVLPADLNKESLIDFIKTCPFKDNNKDLLMSLYHHMLNKKMLTPEYLEVIFDFYKPDNIEDILIPFIENYIDIDLEYLDNDDVDPETLNELFAKNESMLNVFYTRGLTKEKLVSYFEIERVILKSNDNKIQEEVQEEDDDINIEDYLKLKKNFYKKINKNQKRADSSVKKKVMFLL